MTLKVLVAVRQVATLDPEFELRDDNLSVDPDFIDYEMNEWDTFSLEAALLLKDAGEAAAEVIVVTVGDGESEEMLLGCLAKGADRAVRIDAENVNTADALTNAHLLSAVVRREAPDLVLCGVQASDTVNGATGSAVAGLSGLPCVAVVRSFELNGNAEATVSRELEGGTLQRLSVPLPALLTIQTGINQPRYATLRAIKQARTKPLAVITPSELDVDGPLLTGAGARLKQLHIPEEEGNAEMLEGDAASIAQRIATIVREHVA